MRHHLIALEKGLEKAHLPLNGDFNNDQAINLDLVVSVARTETQCFLRDTNGEGDPRRGRGLEAQVTVYLLEFTLVGNVHRRCAFLEDTRDTRDSLYRHILSQAYSAKDEK